MVSRKDATIVTNPDGSKVPGYIQDGRSYYADGTSIVGGASVVDLSCRTWTKPLDDAAKAVESIANKAGIVVSGAVDAVQAGSSRGGGAGRRDVVDNWPGSGPVITDTGQQSSPSSSGKDYSVNLGDIAGSLGLNLDSGWLSWLIPLLIVFLFLRMALRAVRRD